jgi:D-glycero-alpha-D-manno-heptose-7-phosphate kinase
MTGLSSMAATILHVSPTITASAPARVDLAGGTIDIWPVCHLLGRPAVTVNVALDLCAHIEIDERDDGMLEVISSDLGETVLLPGKAVTHDKLGLATRMAEWFGVGTGLTIRLRSGVPPHSGLGGSSALAIALAGALARLRGSELEGESLRSFAQNIETALLGKPTGYQDYYPALYGGVQRLKATPTGVERRALEGADEFLARHLLVIDTNIQHHSGMNNWEVVRAFLEGDAEVAKRLRGISACAERVEAALETRSLAALAAAMNEEWRLRRELAPVVSNERIEALISAARGAGALAAKVCGAGGGGCLAVIAEDRAIIDALPAGVDSGGLHVEDYRK